TTTMQIAVYLYENGPQHLRDIKKDVCPNDGAKTLLARLKAYGIVGRKKGSRHPWNTIWYLTATGQNYLAYRGII
ncbi:unnamed protein product, partial [marine sediment metagenome]